MRLTALMAVLLLLSGCVVVGANSLRVWKVHLAEDGRFTGNASHTLVGSQSQIEANQDSINHTISRFCFQGYDVVREWNEFGAPITESSEERHFEFHCRAVPDAGTQVP